MYVDITVSHLVKLEDEDAQAIENGSMAISDIDWSYYLDQPGDTVLEDIVES